MKIDIFRLYLDLKFFFSIGNYLNDFILTFSGNIFPR